MMAMGKVGLGSIFHSYFETLYDASTRRISFQDVAIQVVVPIAVGAGYFVLSCFGAVDLLHFGELITVVAIVSSLLCALALMLFDLRKGFHKGKKKSQVADREVLLIDELFDDVMWCVVAGFVSAFSMAVSGVSGGAFPGFDRIAAAVALTFLLNFVLVTCMCLKRMSAVYRIVSHSDDGK